MDKSRKVKVIGVNKKGVVDITEIVAVMGEDILKRTSFEDLKE